MWETLLFFFLLILMGIAGWYGFMVIRLKIKLKYREAGIVEQKRGW